MDQNSEITREELHQMVWWKPTRTLAKEYGLSDNGLAKICRKLGVKKPPRGFWTKVATGMRIKTLPLGALPDGCASKTAIRGKRDPPDDCCMLEAAFSHSFFVDGRRSLLGRVAMPKLGAERLSVATDQSSYGKFERIQVHGREGAVKIDLNFILRNPFSSDE